MPGQTTSAMVGQVSGGSNVELLASWPGLVLVAVLAGIGSILTAQRGVT